MQLEFIKVSPTENMTIYIKNEIERRKHIDVANQLMDYAHLYAEQVGFIERLDSQCVHLQMMGGEFCVNASRGLAAILVRDAHPSVIYEDGKFIVPLTVSGTKGEIQLLVEENADDDSYDVTIKLENNATLEQVNIKYNGMTIQSTWVHLQGISHLIVDVKLIDEPIEFLEKVKEQCDVNGLEAFGIMFLDKETVHITPLVYVQGTDSLVWERGCGSGTIATGLYLYSSGETEEVIDIHQPGGTMRFSGIWENGHINRYTLKGNVRIVAQGMVFLKETLHEGE
jgi:diaminopimelate epimerase